MARKSIAQKFPKEQDNPLLIEVLEHYADWEEDNEQRMNRKNGWNDITDAYWGKLPDDWPYESKVVDPILRTVVIEKNSRLLNQKLRGRLVPRDGTGDILGARINNALLDFQWDNANEGGTMDEKVSICEQDTRLYASKFALTKWKTEKGKDGELLFDGNEMVPIDLRDFGMDFAASHIRDAKWAQVRTWEFLEDLENKMEGGKKMYSNLGILKQRMSDPTYAKKSDKRDTAWISRIKTLKGLEDRVGTDNSFPIVEIVKEYRRDKWITFSPRYKVLLHVGDNPYDHHKIPISQLRYYPLQDDPYGESEAEAVLPMWKAIQATLCAYLDEMNMKIRPPLKILEGAVSIETIEFGADAQWLMTRPDGVTEFNVSGDQIRWFQTTYSALKSAFSTAMGELSQGVGGVDPFNPEKTATEVRASSVQRNARDQKNQNSIAEFIKDIMSMWMSNNQQFLFRNPEKLEYIIRVVGNESFNYFKRAGLDDMEVSNESMRMLADIIVESGGELDDLQVDNLIAAAEMPKFPVVENPNEKDPAKIKVKPKMTISERGDEAELSLIPEDLNGTYDYIADVKSAAAGADAELTRARTAALNTLTNNQNVLQLLQQEGFKPAIKEMLVSSLEETGLKDADRFFERIDNEQNPQQITGGTPQGILPPESTGAVRGPGADIQNEGLSGSPATLPTGGLN